MKMRRVLVIVGLLLAAALVVGFFLRRDGNAAASQYRTETVEAGDVTRTVTATGTLSAVTTVQVGSQVSGIIARLSADFNSPVKKGQVLAELDRTPFEAQVAQRRADVTQAEVQMRNAEVNYRRQERLLAEQLVPQSDFDTAKANFDATKAQVDQAKAALLQADANLRYTTIESPIDGVVVDRQYDVGQTVAASFQAPTLFTIAQDLTKMQMQADVDQSDIGQVSVGQIGHFTVDAYPDERFEGRISQIRLNATVNQNVITYPVIVEVANPERKLRPKMTADVSIDVAKVEGALRVPNAALRFRPPDAPAPRPQSGGGEGAAAAGARGGGGGGRRSPGAMSRQVDQATGGTPAPKRGQTVYVLTASGKLEPREIRTGISDGRYTAVVDGSLAAGDRVVVGLATLRSAEGAAPPTGAAPGGPRGPRGF
jgi:HlyD family secretion protein